MVAQSLTEALEHVIHNIRLVPLDADLYQRLIDLHNGRDNVAAIVEHQLEFYLERMEEESGTSYESNSELGVLFGKVLLPHGTLLRTKHHGDWKQAEIQNGEILWDGNTYESVAKACNAMRGDTSNNAWLVLEVKRPKDSSFRQAERLRR